MKDTLTLLCNDPGYKNIGLSILQYKPETQEVSLLKAENITLMTNPKNTLWDLFEYYGDFIKGLDVDIFVYEKPYLSGPTLVRNIGMLEGIGLIKTQVLRTNPSVNINFYSPNTIKKVVAKSGKANKTQVSDAVKDMFQDTVDFNIPFNHACDSIAVGLCYLNEYYKLPLNK